MKMHTWRCNLWMDKLINRLLLFSILVSKMTYILQHVDGWIGWCWKLHSLCNEINVYADDDHAENYIFLLWSFFLICWTSFNIHYLIFSPPRLGKFKLLLLFGSNLYYEIGDQCMVMDWSIWILFYFFQFFLTNTSFLTLGFNWSSYF